MEGSFSVRVMNVSRKLPALRLGSSSPSFTVPNTSNRLATMPTNVASVMVSSITSGVLGSAMLSSNSPSWNA